MDESEFLDLLTLAQQFEDEGNDDIAEELRAQAQEAFDAYESEQADEDDDGDPDYLDPNFEGFYEVPEEWYDHDYEWEDFYEDFDDVEETETDS